MSDIVYGTPKKLQDGRYYVKVSKADDARVMIQLNKVKILTQFDASDDVTLELNQAALEKISGTDSNNIAAAKLNCQSWFGKALADQTLETAYNKSIQDASMNTTKAKENRELFTANAALGRTQGKRVGGVDMK
jgi:hypothetical protein